MCVERISCFLVPDSNGKVIQLEVLIEWYCKHDLQLQSGHSWFVYCISVNSTRTSRSPHSLPADNLGKVKSFDLSGLLFIIVFIRESLARVKIGFSGLQEEFGRFVNDGGQGINTAGHLNIVDLGMHIIIGVVVSHCFFLCNLMN